MEGTGRRTKELVNAPMDPYKEQLLVGARLTSKLYGTFADKAELERSRSPSDGLVHGRRCSPRNWVIALMLRIAKITLLWCGALSILLVMIIALECPIAPHGPYTYPSASAVTPSATILETPPLDILHQSIWTETFTPAQQKIIDRFTPIIKLHSEEDFYPSDIDWMLGRFSRAMTREREDVRSVSNGSSVDFPLDRMTLPRLPMSGWGMWLDINEVHDAQPGFSSENSQYLYGRNGRTAQDRRRRNAAPLQPGGKRSATSASNVIRDPVYAFYVDKGEGIVDLFYWTFYPYNLGKKIGLAGYIGNHVGDWEHVRVRTVNGTGHSVDFSVHRDLKTGTWRWADVEKLDGRPVAYSAKGSHGLWPTPGPQVYHSALFGLFKLIDHTDDRGTIWDPIAEAVPWRPWPGNLWGNPRYGMDGRSAWLNYAGRWGDSGSRDCWIWRFGHTCSMADSPVGPNRWFGGPPKCIIAPLAPSNSPRSRINFRMNPTALSFARDRNLTHVKAEAVCSDSSGWKEAPRTDSAASLLPPGGIALDPGKSIAPLEGIGRTTFEVEVDACPTAGWHRTYITGYRLSLCNDTSMNTSGLMNCPYSSPIRDVCSYLADESNTVTSRGYTSGQAVDLIDTDPWSWRYEGVRDNSQSGPEGNGWTDWEWLQVAYVYLAAYFEVFWR